MSNTFFYEGKKIAGANPPEPPSYGPSKRLGVFE